MASCHDIKEFIILFFYILAEFVIVYKILLNIVLTQIFLKKKKKLYICIHAHNNMQKYSNKTCTQNVCIIYTFHLLYTFFWSPLLHVYNFALECSHNKKTELDEKKNFFGIISFFAYIPFYSKKGPYAKKSLIWKRLCVGKFISNIYFVEDNRWLV